MMRVSGILLLWVCCSAPAKELIVGMGNFEPFFIADSRDGVFVEVVEKVFENMPGYTLEMFFGLANHELVLAYKKGILDGITNVLEPMEGACLTEPVFRFQDVAVTRKDDNITINSLQDLKGRTIVTYQGASVFWDKPFTDVISPDHYVELGDPNQQVKLLSAGRVNVSIGDLYIFIHSVKKNRNRNLTLDQFTFHRIFPQKFSYMAFKEQEICQAFNQALLKVRENGDYEQIYQRYLTQYGLRVPD